MRCLVTGAAGFIGDALVKRLIKEGHEVKALLHKTKPNIYEKKAEYATGDITNIDLVKPLVKDVDVVFHCAAFARDYGPKEIFLRVNFEGTKNLVLACEAFEVKKFIFLSHIRSESKKAIGYYSKTKAMAEHYLLDKYKKDRFPVIIIRPGNVYGPGAKRWVLRLLQAIKKNRIALIDGGKGIFLHTYIDNLVDALLAAMKEPRVIGEMIDVTDGDNNTSWGKYLISLAKMTGKTNIKWNLSKKTVLLLSKLAMISYRLFKIEPLVTPMAVEVFTNQQKVSIEKARYLLGYKPKIDYQEGMKQIEKWLRTENYIS